MRSGQRKKRPKMRMLSMLLALALAAANILPMQPAEAAETHTVYLNGQGGSNENSGESSENAVSTLTKAKELLGESGGTIIVTGTLNVSWETTWSMPSGSILKAAPGLEGPIIAVAKAGALTLNNIVIDGQKGNVISNSGYLELKENAVLQADGSRISAESAVYTAKEATTMKDGVLIAGVEKSEKDPDIADEKKDTGVIKESETASADTGTNGSTAGTPSSDTETTESVTEPDSWQPDTTEQSESHPVNTTPATEVLDPGASPSQTETTITETIREDTVTEAPAGNKGTAQITTETETEPAEATGPAGSTEPAKTTEPAEDTELAKTTEPAESSETTESTKTTDKYVAGGQNEAKTSGTEKADAQAGASDTTVPEEEPTNNLGAFNDMVYSLRVESREDISRVVEVTKIYDALNENDKSRVTEEAYNLLVQAQNAAGGLNHAHNSVSVSGNLPWYVQFTAEINNSRESGDTSRIIVPYDLKLWDMYRNTAYVLEAGEKVTVTMPVPDADLSNGVTIYHYKADGTTEVLHPVINGDTMSFETDSFSPFDVAGGTLLAGIGVNNSNNYTGGGTSSSNQSNNNTNSTQNNNNGNTNSNNNSNNSNTTTSGSNTTTLKPQPAGNTLAASPNTGDAAPIAVMIMGLIISGGTIFLMLRGKRKMQ